ncbi:hypothetical protein GCM10019059_19330 [Camelimonas fluminis]|nr:hypothetical protein GCM10019059_19330 [Camelimonas fluminis]
MSANATLSASLMASTASGAKSDGVSRRLEPASLAGNDDAFDGAADLAAALPEATGLDLVTREPDFAVLRGVAVLAMSLPSPSRPANSAIASFQAGMSMRRLSGRAFQTWEPVRAAAVLAQPSGTAPLTPSRLGDTDMHKCLSHRLFHHLMFKFPRIAAGFA